MIEKQHIVTAFDEDLAILNDMMAKMGALAETQLFASTEALITRNPSSLDDIIKRDKELDNLEAELNDKVTELNNGEPMKLLREERNKRLSETDWMANSDVTMTDAWKTYRQALRDLPASSTPKLNSIHDLDLTSVTWPTKPS